MSQIGLERARNIVARSLEKARELGLRPLTVAVMDAGGHLIVLEREDGASIMRPQVAMAKASTALALGQSSRNVGTMAAERPVFVGSLASLWPAGIVPAAGGVLVLDDAGNTIGAVGITGDTSDNDEACALAGIAASGLATQQR